MNSNRQRLSLGLGPSCKSTHSNIPYQVTFRNLTDHEVLLYWINYQGKPKFYGLLRRTKAIGEGLAIDTFVTHPWIAINKTKLEVLSINFSNVLRPISKRDFIKEEQKIDRLRVCLSHSVHYLKILFETGQHKFEAFGFAHPPTIHLCSSLEYF